MKTTAAILPFSRLLQTVSLIAAIIRRELWWRAYRREIRRCPALNTRRAHYRPRPTGNPKTRRTLT